VRSSTRWGRAVPVVALLVLGACSDATQQEPPALYVTAKRAWLPGERAALIQRIMTNHEYVFPFAGDISDLAPQLYADTDSVVILVPNPALDVATPTEPVGIERGPAAANFNLSWNFLALKETIVDKTNAPPDTVFWHLAMWADPANGGNHGFVIAFSRTNTFNITPIRTPNFNTVYGTAGAAAGEFHSSTATYWEDDGTGGRYQVTAQNYPGAFSTIASGPFKGGLSRTGTANGRVTNSAFVRVSGSESPANYTVAFDYRVTALNSTEIQCTFPSPCTTNVPIVLAALRRGGPLPDSVRARLPWASLVARAARP